MEPTTDVPKQSHHSCASSLENLPSEIKVMILSQMPCLSSVSSIVHASPTYYQAYLGAREEILHNITVRILQRNDIGLLDPWTAVHAPHLDHDSPPRVKLTKEYLERYAEGHMDSRRRLAPKDSLAILSLHGKLTFLIAKYCKAQFSHNPLVEAADNDPLPPSQSELHRLYRAFWRYEIYSNFFGPSNEPSGRNSSVAGIDRVIENEPSQIPDYTFRADEIVDGFFGLFPTHEVEELACLAEITRNYYLCFESSSCWERRNQLVTLGPKQLYQVLTAAAENECEARIAEVMKAERVAVTMRDALDEYDTDVSWWGWHWRDKCKIFVSERGSTVGWLWASSRGVQNTDHSLRRWGYVFWGQERLDAWGITQEHMGNWPHCRRTPGDLARQMWS